MRRLAGACLVFSITLSAAAALGNEPEVTRKGRTVVQYRDDTAKILMGYRHASLNVEKADWMLLETFWQGVSKSFTVGREDVTLVVPGGQGVPLPSQKRVAKEFTDIRRFMAHVNVSRDPLEGYFPYRVEEQPIQLFAIPGEGITLEEFSAGPSTLMYGDLLFPAPEGGFRPGKYVLEVRNKDLDVRIPFTLPAPPLSKKGDEPKAVTW
jgi:hypothetical protein